MAPDTHCPDHSDLVAHQAAELEARRHLEAADTETAKAVKELEKRLGKVENKLARYGGAIALLAALPAIWKLLELLGVIAPVARAATGG